MESSLEMMETSETESPTKSEVELSSQVESNVKESLSGTQASHQVASNKVEKVSQEISSHAVPSSTTGVVSSQTKSSQVASSSLPSTSAEALVSAASSDLENGPAQKKPRVDYKTMTSGVYLDSTVVPILHVALVTLDRIRPADPVQFVIDFLLKNKAQYSKKIASGTSANQA